MEGPMGLSDLIMAYRYRMFTVKARVRYVEAQVAEASRSLKKNPSARKKELLKTLRAGLKSSKAQVRKEEAVLERVLSGLSKVPDQSLP